MDLAQAGPNGRLTMPRNLALIYVALASAFFGWIATYSFGQPLVNDVPNADIWQHLATIGALMQDPVSPPNPFVATSDSSRLFGPYWWVVAVTARAFGLTPMQAYGLGAVLSLTLFVSSIWAFACAYYRSAAGPLALLAVVVAGWIIPPVYTGYYDPLSLMTGAAYPATMSVAAMLFQWAVTIRLLEGGSLRRYGVAQALVVAFAVATHPFTAAVALLGTACFALLWPQAKRDGRLMLAWTTAAGLGLAALWPFFNPYAVLATAASPRWFGIDFYTPKWLFGSLVPAIIGIYGLIAPRRAGTGRPLLLAALPVAAGFAIGASPAFAAGHRLLPVLVLILQIGLADLLLRIRNQQRAAWAALPIAVCLVGSAWTTHDFLQAKRVALRTSDLFLASSRILSEVPRDVGIAGYSAASFPFVAHGRRVLSTPFPEPLIHDQPQRMRLSDRLFDPRLSQVARNELARRTGVGVLVAYAPKTPGIVLSTLDRQARRKWRSGPLVAYLL